MIAGSLVARIGAWLSVLALAVLSWTPGQYMVRTDVLTGHEEHFLAYLIANAIIAAATRGSTPLRTAILLWLYAGVLELGQNFVPGRHPAIEDFVVSASGALVGIVLTTVLRARVSRSH
jgi:VanZ family protein